MNAMLANTIGESRECGVAYIPPQRLAEEHFSISVIASGDAALNREKTERRP